MDPRLRDEPGQRLVAAVAAPVHVGDRVTQLGAGVGVANAAGATPLRELVQPAGTAMYAAKANGKNCVQVFRPGMLQGGPTKRCWPTADRLATAPAHLQVGAAAAPVGDREDLVGHEQPVGSDGHRHAEHGGHEHVRGRFTVSNRTTSRTARKEPMNTTR